MPKNKKEWFAVIKRILLVILGSFVLGIGTGVFLVPYDIISGGISGIAIILNYFWSWDVQLVITILTWGFFFLGWILLGTKFAAKTIISAIVYPPSLMLGQYLSTLPWLHIETLLTIDSIQFVSTGYLVTAIFGGILVGTGCALTFLGGGSTGGVDVITMSIQKYTGFKAGYSSFIIDSCTILIGLVAIKRFDFTLIGIISAFFASIMINKIFDTEKNVAVSIISKEYEKINQFILEKLDRGSTIINAIGGYSDEEVKMIQVVLDVREYYILQEIVAKVDPRAFMYMHRVGSVRGEGFKEHVNSLSSFSKKK